MGNSLKSYFLSQNQKYLEKSSVMVWVGKYHRKMNWWCYIFNSMCTWWELKPFQKIKVSISGRSNLFQNNQGSRRLNSNELINAFYLSDPILHVQSTKINMRLYLISKNLEPIREIAKLISSLYCGRISGWIVKALGAKRTEFALLIPPTELPSLWIAHNHWGLLPRAGEN